MRSRWTGFESPLAGHIDAFLAHKRALGCRYRTEEAGLRLLDRFLVDRNVPSVDNVSSEVLEAFFASRPRSAPRSYNHLIGVVERLLDWAVVQRRLERSPLQAQRRRETSRRVPFIFDRAQARRLLEVAARLRDNSRAPLRGPTYFTAFAVLYGLGLRVGEVSRLVVADVDLGRDLLFIRDTKFSKSRLVPFGPGLRAKLCEFMQLRRQRGAALASNEPLLSFTGGPVHPGTISQTFHQLVPRLGLRLPAGTSPPRVHDLRHSFAVGTLLRWYREGIDPSDRLHRLATFLGHVDPASTAVYLTITSELLAEANDRFERFAVDAVVEVRP